MNCFRKCHGLARGYLLEISCLTQENNLTPGENWNNFSVTTKVYCVLGFQQGIAMSLVKLTPKINDLYMGILSDEEETWDELREAWNELKDLSTFIEKHGSATLKIMDDLYKDPANTYIYTTDIIEIACKKLKGEDIEPLLQKARKEALKK